MNDFGRLLKRLREDRSLTWKELAEGVERDVATLRRIATEAAPQPHVRRQSTVVKLDDFLGADGQLIKEWRSLTERGVRESYQRGEILALNVEALSGTDRSREFEVFTSTARPSGLYEVTPSVVAFEKRQAELNEQHPLPIEEVVRLASLVDVELGGTVDLSLDGIERTWTGLLELDRAFPGAWADSEPQALVAAFDELADVLTMGDLRRSSERRRDLDVVVVFCGREDHSRRVDRARAVAAAALGAPPLVLVMGSPAGLTTDALISEPDAVLHSLKDSDALDPIDLDWFVPDARAEMYSECGHLSLVHLHRLASERASPFSVGVVGGYFSMLRAYWSMDAATSVHSHVVKELVPLPTAGPPTVPANPPDDRDQWVQSLLLEVRRLCFARASGLI